MKKLVLAFTVMSLPVFSNTPAKSSYTSPDYLQKIPFGTYSHWLQPWRSYMETRPASALTNGLGIVLNIEPQNAKTVCTQLAQSGFRHARIEIGWTRIDFDNPEKIVDAERFKTMIGECAAVGIRPLILLNANSGAPCPIRKVSIKLTRDAHVGDKTIYMETNSYNQVKALADKAPDAFIGLDRSQGRRVAALYSFVDEKPGNSEVAITLSKPVLDEMKKDTSYNVSLLKYAPFDGSSKETLAKTLAGWGAYVKTVTQFVQGAAGKTGFDVEVWNELSFGSEFLDMNNYRAPSIKSGINVQEQILNMTTSTVLNPSLNLKGVGITNGFASQSPWPSRHETPKGVTALSKHPYHNVRSFPERTPPSNAAPINALGEKDSPKDAFEPTYQCRFPEYVLAALQTETMMRDLCPFESKIYNTIHGRSPTSEIWITETNLVIEKTFPNIPLSAEDRKYAFAKGALRMLTSYISKGVARVYFYAASGNEFGLVFDKDRDQSSTPGVFPFPIAVIGRMLKKMQSNTGIKKPVDIQLANVTFVPNTAYKTEGIQFAGNPKTKNKAKNPHPDLRDSDVITFYPFQIDDNRFAIAIYIMSRDLSKASAATGPQRFDMPGENFELTMASDYFKGANYKVSYYDPMLDKEVAPLVKPKTPFDPNLKVVVPVTDGVRLLMITK